MVCVYLNNKYYVINSMFLVKINLRINFQLDANRHFPLKNVFRIPTKNFH